MVWGWGAVPLRGWGGSPWGSGVSKGPIEVPIYLGGSLWGRGVLWGRGGLYGAGGIPMGSYGSAGVPMDLYRAGGVPMGPIGASMGLWGESL